MIEQISTSLVEMPFALVLEDVRGESECEEGEEFLTELEADAGNNPDLWLYRDRTAGLLWRYLRLSVENGRLPSLLGREFFRTKVSPYSAQSFEDSVIFVHDVEACLDALDAADKIVIVMLGLEQYTQEETARSLHCTQRTIARHYADALDHLSQIFLKREILHALPGTNAIRGNACQEGENRDLFVSDSE